MLPLFFSMDFVHIFRYRKPKTTTSDKPMSCIIYLDSNVDKSNRPTSLSTVSNSSLYSREPGMLNAQDLRLRTYKRFTSHPSYNY